MEWTNKHPRLWMAAVGYFLLAGMLALLPDTAMRTMVVEGGLISVVELMRVKPFLLLCLLPAAVQFLLNRLSRLRFLSLLPLLLGAAAHLLAEGFWITGDWERLASAFLLGFCFLPSVSISLEILLEKLTEVWLRNR